MKSADFSANFDFFSAKSVDFSANLPLKIPQNFAFFPRNIRSPVEGGLNRGFTVYNLRKNNTRIFSA